MASKYWIKLYHEILDDSKVMMLRPNLRWRFIESLLMAGEVNEGGLLLDTRQYAWRVRDSFEVVETELTELLDAGLLAKKGGKWYIPKFSDRQKGLEKAEYMARLRAERQNAGQSVHDTTPLPKRYSSVTNGNTDTDTDIDTEPDKTAPSAKTTGGGGDYAHALESYQNNIGTLTPMMQKKIEIACRKHSQQSVIEAVGIAVENGVYKWAYVNAILDRWAVEGKQNGKATTNAAASAWQRVMELAAKSELSQLTGIERIAATAVGGDKLRGAKPERFKAQFMEAYDNAARKNNLQPTG